MWASRAEVQYLRERVRELERDLKDERTENRRVERHYGNMLLRRAGTYPVPPPKSEQPELKHERPKLDESDKAKVDAVIRAAKEMNLGDQELAEGIKRTVPHITDAEVQAVISGSRVNGNGQL